MSLGFCRISRIASILDRAKQSGWDAFILSDQLNVRQYSSNDSWAVGPMLTQAEEAEALIAGNKANSGPSTQQTNVIPGVSTTVAPIPGSLPAQPQAGSSEALHPMLSDLVSALIARSVVRLLMSISKADSQRAAMLQLQQMTGLNFQYTAMCLEANGWDLGAAKNNYDELISSTPVSVGQMINSFISNGLSLAHDTSGSIHSALRRRS